MLIIWWNVKSWSVRKKPVTAHHYSKIIWKKEWISNKICYITSSDPIRLDSYHPKMKTKKNLLEKFLPSVQYFSTFPVFCPSSLPLFCYKNRTISRNSVGKLIWNFLVHFFCSTKNIFHRRWWQWWHTHINTYTMYIIHPLLRKRARARKSIF